MSDIRSSIVQLHWWRPPMIIFSAIATSFAAFGHLGAVLSSFIVTWFLFVCPGLVIVHFLHLHEFIVEYVLALALSLAIDAMVAAFLLYVGWWSPTAILNILVSFCLLGAIIQLVCSQWSGTANQLPE